MQQAHLFQTQITRSARLGYLLHLPPGADTSARWPLIFFLHGRGESGTGSPADLEKVKIHGVAKIVEQQPDFPFIVVSPQCAVRSWWTYEVEPLRALLDDVLARLQVDPTRVYLTGLSMGGYGAWAMGAAYPQYFAAVAPICGGGNPEDVCGLKNTPVWAFHGDQDDVVPLSESEKMVGTLRGCGGNVEFTIYEGVGHNSWTQTYARPELYEWFLSHRR